MHKYGFLRSCEQPEGRAVEQDAHIEGALAAEASLVVLDTLESVVQADGGGGIKSIILSIYYISTYMR